MKKILLLSVCLLLGVMTYAQQALWGGAPVVSPEVHDNNTVTFRLKAPKAVKVQVTGDFLPTRLPHRRRTGRPLQGERRAPRHRVAHLV